MAVQEKRHVSYADAGVDVGEGARAVDAIKDAVREIRRIRTSMNVAPGQQAEVILLSRLEWLRLIGEYFERRVYIKTEEEYRKPLELLYGEYLAERDRFDRTYGDIRTARRSDGERHADRQNDQFARTV